MTKEIVLTEKGKKAVKQIKEELKMQTPPKDKDVGKRIKELIDSFYKTPIGELPKRHFWIDRNNMLCCGQITTKIKVDVTEALSTLKKYIKEEDKQRQEDSIELLKLKTKNEELKGRLTLTVTISNNYYEQLTKAKSQLQNAKKDRDNVFDDIEKLNNHPLKKDGCFHIELIRSDIDKLKHHHLPTFQKEKQHNYRKKKDESVITGS